MKAKWLKLISYLWPKRLKNHTLWGRAYLYSPYKGVPLPSGEYLSGKIFHKTRMHWLFSSLRNRCLKVGGNCQVKTNRVEGRRGTFPFFSWFPHSPLYAPATKASYYISNMPPTGKGAGQGLLRFSDIAGLGEGREFVYLVQFGSLCTEGEDRSLGDKFKNCSKELLPFQILID